MAILPVHKFNVATQTLDIQDHIHELPFLTPNLLLLSQFFNLWMSLNLLLTCPYLTNRQSIQLRATLIGLSISNSTTYIFWYKVNLYLKWAHPSETVILYSDWTLLASVQSPPIFLWARFRGDIFLCWIAFHTWVISIFSDNYEYFFLVVYLALKLN